MAGTSQLIVSVSGIRGIVGEGLTPQAALAFAQALGTYAQGGSIAVGRDGRPSGMMLQHAVLAGLLSVGCPVHDLGVLPTPTVGVAVRRLRAAGGMQITASHNPAPWNGLKLFGDEGRVLSPGRGKEVHKLFESGAFARQPWDRLGQVHACPEALAWHRDVVLGLVEVDRIRGRRFTVLLDANGGAGGPLGCQLLEALGCRVIALGSGADGAFAHEPEPIAENLTGVCPRVREAGADVGFVLDPDADRLALIDETGRYIGEELTLALAVRFRLRQERGPVVINMSTSRLVEDICRQCDVPCQRAAVGEANVVDLMQQKSAVIGGEGNGGVIDPRVGWVRDPFIGMGMVLNLLAAEGRTLSQVVASLSAYHIVKTRFTVDPRTLPQLFEKLTRHWPEAAVNRLDGLRLDWANRWLHVRPSNTEPIVRIIAEAPTQAEAEQLCRDAGGLL